MLLFRVMRSRLAIFAALTGALVLGATAVADAWVVTDREQLEGVLDALTSERPGRRVDAFLAYVDPLREPVALRTDAGARDFGEGDEVELASEIRRALASIDRSSIDIVQRAVETREEDATVALRTRTANGMLDVRADLRRHGDRWLLRRLNVR
jgi:hypothetical protein